MDKIVDLNPTDRQHRERIKAKIDDPAHQVMVLIINPDGTTERYKSRIENYYKAVSLLEFLKVALILDANIQG